MHRRLVLTHHARERWLERIGIGPRGLQCGVKIPVRHARERWPLLTTREHFERHFVTPTAVLVVRRRSVVVTVVETTVEDLATVLVWLMTGVW